MVRVTDQDASRVLLFRGFAGTFHGEEIPGDLLVGLCIPSGLGTH